MVSNSLGWPKTCLIENRNASFSVINSNQIFILFDIFDVFVVCFPCMFFFLKEFRFIWSPLFAPMIPVTHECCQSECAKIWNNVSVKGVFFLVFLSLISHWLTIPLKTLYQWTEAIKCTQQNKARKIAWSKMENGIFLHSFVRHCQTRPDGIVADISVSCGFGCYVQITIVHHCYHFYSRYVYFTMVFSGIFFCDFSICLWLACASFIWQYLVRSQSFVHLN